MEEEYLYILISKYFSKEITLKEKELLNNWRKEDMEHELHFRQLEELWNLSGVIYNPVQIQKEILWQRIEHEIVNKEKVIQIHRPIFRYIASVAALFLLLITISFIYILNNEPELDVLVKSLPGQKNEIVLPDGSEVWLNSDSYLTYNTGYPFSNRDVALTGEAYFDIRKFKKKTFSVVLGKFKVEVLGTAFNIKAYPDEDRIEVSLQEGKVNILSSADNQFLTSLKPDQKAILSTSKLTYHIESCDADTESIWRHGILRIEGETIKQVLKKMERWYGVTIHLDQSIPDDEQYWLTIKTESLNEMLQLINKIKTIQYQINGEEVNIIY